MKILAVETSCDDTAIAVLEASKKSGFKVLSGIVSSQIEIHKKWGGVYPMLAKREHQKNLVPVLEKALRKAKMLETGKSETDEDLKAILKREENLYKHLNKFLKKYKKPDIDLIAVTNGPGLEPCLWVGINFAKALSYYWNIPIITVNHIKAHIFANRPFKKNDFPALCLVVSGGHTLLFLMKGFGKHKMVGETRDDAAGECFDKTAKILGLEYPGGPIIAKLAKKLKSRGGPSSTKLPRPMINTKDYDFSFSGLKTAVLYNYKKQPLKIRKSKQYIQEICAETQQAIIDVLIRKTLKAAQEYKVKTIMLGGGVTANKELRKQFKEKSKDFKLMMPDAQYSTDNAVMVAIAGYFRWKNNARENWKNIKAKPNLKIK